MTARRASVLTQWLAGIGLALASLAGAVPAWAGSLSVMPVRVDVAAGRRFCSLTLGNDSDRPMAVQVRAYAWSREESGADVFDPEPGFLVNPPITTLAPGASKLVRCSLPAPDPAVSDPASQAERQWRLIVDQLPDPDYDVPGTVQTLLRISIPVFRAGDKAAPRLAASLATAGGGHAVRIANPGTAHVKGLAVTLTGPDGDAVTMTRTFYLLAGGAQVVPVERLPRGGVATVHLRAEEGEFDIALTPVK